MKDITVRVDDELHEQLQDLADEEGEPISVIVRRAVRHHVRTQRPDVRTSSSAHEGTGRVR
jgi:predicted transcriptional regulator